MRPHGRVRARSMALVPEARLAGSLRRGLMEVRPSRMFEVLRGMRRAGGACCPEVDCLWGRCRSAPTTTPRSITGVPSDDGGSTCLRALDGSLLGALRVPRARTSAKARRRSTCCRATSATKQRSGRSGGAARCVNALRVPGRVPRGSPRLSRASTANGAPQRASSGAAAVPAPDRALRCDPAARSLLPRCCWPASCDGRAGGSALSESPYPAGAARLGPPLSSAR